MIIYEYFRISKINYLSYVFKPTTSDQTLPSPQARNIYANPYFNENNFKNTPQPVYYPKDTEKYMLLRDIFIVL